MRVATLVVPIDPTIEIGPVTLAWHGLTIALGVLLGGLVAASEARHRGLDPAPISAIAIIVVLSALVGGKLYYLAEHGRLLEPGAWLSSRGFTFYGGVIAAAILIPLYVWRARLSAEYLDAVAVGLPLGIAVGRIGDVINGEHYGPPTDFFLGVKNTHPEADVPSNDVAYHSGGLYEVLLGAIVFAIVWRLRWRLRAPTAAMWVVLALLALGRFAEFFVRSDSAGGALGLETAQWTSVALVCASAVGAWLTVGRVRRRRAGVS